MRVVHMPIFQIRISIFDPKMTVISVKCGDVIKIKSNFWAIYRHLTQKQITPLDS